MLNEELKNTRDSLIPPETSNSKEESLVGFDPAENSLQSTPNEGETCRNAGDVEEDEATALDRVCLFEGDHGHGQDRTVDSREFFLGDA
jgi:hypothetical protein